MGFYEWLASIFVFSYSRADFPQHFQISYYDDDILDEP